ncbi:MAG: helix-turn-helix domain-containing protein [Ruminococcus sp.]|nr:helix-turn-helix domain-containing protein [Ruminococcus sp.]
MINTQSFVLYESVYKHIQTLQKRVSAETALKYANAVMEFGLYGVIPNEDDVVWIYGFEQAMTSIYSSKEKYSKAIDNGKKGGAPRKYNHELIVELKGQGLTNKQIAEEIGCAEITVSRALKEEREKSEEDQNNISNLNLKEKEKDNEKETVTVKANDNQNRNINLNSKQKDNESNLFTDYI